MIEALRTWHVMLQRTSSPPGSPSGCEIELAYAIGVPFPISITVDTFGTAKAPEERIAEAAIEQESSTSRRPASFPHSTSRTPIYQNTSNYGHFGREGFAWEKTDRAETLAKEVG